MKDTINRGGEKFGPIEVEEALRTHPAVSDVAVAGFADEEMGQRVGAAVVARVSADARGAAIALPRTDRLLQAAGATDRSSTSIPYNDTGKVNRRQLAALIADGA